MLHECVVFITTKLLNATYTVVIISDILFLFLLCSRRHYSAIDTKTLFGDRLYFTVFCLQEDINYINKNIEPRNLKSNRQSIIEHMKNNTHKKQQNKTKRKHT